MTLEYIVKFLIFSFVWCSNIYVDVMESLMRVPRNSKQVKRESNVLNLIQSKRKLYWILKRTGPKEKTVKQFHFPAGNCMIKVNYRNARTRCEIWSKLTMKKPERWHWLPSGFFIFNFEYILHLVLKFLLLTLIMQLQAVVSFWCLYC